MTLHKDTFGYSSPTDEQQASMQVCREAAAQYAVTLEEILPDGPDKTFVLRKLRTLAMWANVAITRHADGSARP
jgi:hypothetical protein